MTVFQTGVHLEIQTIMLHEILSILACLSEARVRHSSCSSDILTASGYFNPLHSLMLLYQLVLGLPLLCFPFILPSNNSFGGEFCLFLCPKYHSFRDLMVLFSLTFMFILDNTCTSSFFTFSVHDILSILL